MSLVVACPQCRQQYSAPEEAAGQVMNCPQCQVPIQVPATKVHSHLPHGMGAVVACPQCRQEFSAPIELLGKQVPCPSCQTPIHVGAATVAPAQHRAPPSATPANAAPPAQSNLLLIVIGGVVGTVVLVLLLAIVGRSLLTKRNDTNLAALPAEAAPIVTAPAPVLPQQKPKALPPTVEAPQARTEEELLAQVQSGKINGIEFFEQLEKLKLGPYAPKIDGNTPLREVSPEVGLAEVQKRMAERAAARSGNNPAHATELQNQQDLTALVQMVAVILKSVQDVPTAKDARVKLSPMCERWVELHRRPGVMDSKMPATDQLTLSRPYLEAFFQVGMEMRRIDQLSPQVNAELTEFKEAMLGGKVNADRQRLLEKMQQAPQSLRSAN